MVIGALSNVYLGYISELGGGIESLRRINICKIMTIQRDDEISVILTPFSRSQKDFMNH